MNRIAAIVAREIRKALPAAIFFLFLFHLIALTKAVSLRDFSITALSATGATIGALIVAKAILIVEALPIGRIAGASRALQIVWKTLLYSGLALLFRLLEELIPLLAKHDNIVQAIAALDYEVSWPLFGVLALWIVAGLALYCLAAELVRALGAREVRSLLLSQDGSGRA